MYGLIKDFFKCIFCSSPGGVVFVSCWSFVQFLINILIKIFIVLPIYLLKIIFNFITTVIYRNYPQINKTKILKYKFILGIFFLLLSVFWFCCTMGVYNATSIVNTKFISNVIDIVNKNWEMFALISLGYTLFVFISLFEELGILGVLYSGINIIGFYNKKWLYVFVIMALIFAVYCCFYIISKFVNLEFRSTIMEDLEADTTLKGMERISYYMNKRKKW